jgi:hypothetical protein
MEKTHILPSVRLPCSVCFQQLGCLSDFHEIAVKIIHKYLSKKVGFWEFKLVHSHGIRSSKVLPIEKEEEEEKSGETLLKEERKKERRKERKIERKKEKAIGNEASSVASFVHFN